VTPEATKTKSDPGGHADPGGHGGHGGQDPGGRVWPRRPTQKQSL